MLLTDDGQRLNACTGTINSAIWFLVALTGNRDGSLEEIFNPFLPGKVQHFQNDIPQVSEIRVVALSGADHIHAEDLLDVPGRGDMTTIRSLM